MGVGGSSWPNPHSSFHSRIARGGRIGANLECLVQHSQEGAPKLAGRLSSSGEMRAGQRGGKERRCHGTVVTLLEQLNAMQVLVQRPQILGRQRAGW